MDARKLLLALALGSLAMPAAAQVTEIFKCRDARGQWTYTNDRRQAEKDKCEQVTTQVNVAPPQKAARPSNFPRESSAERAAGKGRQREILQQELANEASAIHTHWDCGRASGPGWRSRAAALRRSSGDSGPLPGTA